MTDSAPDTRGLPSGYPLNPSWEITPADTQRLRGAGADMLLLDCRRPAEHDVARIERCTLIPLDELAGRLPELASWRNRPVVVYCHTGRRSLRAAAMMREAGFRDVRSMAGGIHAWSLAIDPKVPVY